MAKLEKDRQNRANGELIRSRREAKGWSQARLAREVGVSQQTIYKLEHGTIGQTSHLPIIAKTLQIDLHQLIPDIAPARGAVLEQVSEQEFRGDKEDLPVHVATEGGAGELIVSTDPVFWVRRPTPLANVVKAYGIIVIGESMVPEFEPGDIALVNPHLPPIAGHTYVFYAEGDGETRASIKRLVKVSSQLWHVRQHNPGDGQKHDFTLARGEWNVAHRVVAKNYK